MPQSKRDTESGEMRERVPGSSLAALVVSLVQMQVSHTQKTPGVFGCWVAKVRRDGRQGVLVSLDGSAPEGFRWSCSL
jgi:hypothetical protein